MSFFVNNTHLQSVGFNNQEVNSIYYNNTLVWNKLMNWEWGDENEIGDAEWWNYLKLWVSTATDEELQNCVGMTKKISVPDPNIGSTGGILIASQTPLMRCIGANQDGQKTLTFQTAGGWYHSCFEELTDAELDAKTPIDWIGSRARQTCQRFYNYCSAKDAIKTVSKGTVSRGAETTGLMPGVGEDAWIDDPRSCVVDYHDETVFLLSELEFGYDEESCVSAEYSTTTNAECTYGYNAPYSYYTTASNRTFYPLLENGDSQGLDYNADYRYASLWARSPGAGDDQFFAQAYCRRSLATSSSTNCSLDYETYSTYQIGYYLAPAFVIGV